MSRQTAIQTTSANQIQVDAAQSPQRNTAASPWSYMPAMDVVEHQHEFTIDFDAPGIARDQIDLAYDNGELSLHGGVPPRWPESVKPLRQEYGVGDFDRSIPLGRIAEFIDGERISAIYESGVLTVHLPKLASARSRKIPVNGA